MDGTPRPTAQNGRRRLKVRLRTRQSEKISMSTIDSLILREIGLDNFNGTVCTTFNGFKGYSWGSHSHTSEQEFLVDGEPVEAFRLSFEGKLENVTLPSTTLTDILQSIDRANDHKLNQSLFNVVVKISQSIRIIFLNNLHEISQDYRYEVRAIAETSGNYYELFCGLYTRKRGCLDIQRSTSETMECSFSGFLIKCFHFIVRRFDSKLERCADKVHNIGVMLLNDGIYSDASMVVGDRIFSIHKHVLALKSEVFKSMFTHSMVENEQGLVKIDDFDAEIMEELIFYIYTNKTKNLQNFPRELFEAAHKYQISDLEDKCKEHMIFNINSENAVDILDLASVYGLPDLKEKIIKFIKIHEEEIVKQDSYQELLHRDLNLDNVTSTLLLCIKYNLEKLKLQVFDFVKENKKDIMKSEKFMELFDTQGSLMRDIVRHLVLD